MDCCHAGPYRNLVVNDGREKVIKEQLESRGGKWLGIVGEPGGTFRRPNLGQIQESVIYRQEEGQRCGSRQRLVPRGERRLVEDYSEDDCEIALPATEEWLDTMTTVHAQILNTLKMVNN